MRIDTSQPPPLSPPTPPTNPYHIARAYGVPNGGARGISGSAPVAGVGPIAPEPPLPAETRVPTNADRLVAAVVPGGVEFSAGKAPAASPAALPMYRHPADKNAAATAVNVGRKLDVQG